MSCKSVCGKTLLEYWMKSLTLVIITMLVLVGCGQKMTDSRAEAYRNWDRFRAEAICAQAVEHLRLGQLESACKRAREALALDQDYDDARMVLAKARIELGQYADAAAELRRVLHVRVDSAEALYLLAVADEKSGKLFDALNEYRGAYELDDTNFDAVLAAAEVLVAMDRPHDARVYLDNYLDRADGNPGAYELAGRLAMMNNDYAAATKHYRRACVTDVDNPAYVEALAAAQVFGGQADQAVATLTRRTEFREAPAPGWVYTMLGDCHLAAGRLTDAQEAYQKACSLAPDEPAVWTDLAKVLLARRQMAQAANAASKALSLSEDCFEASLVMGYALLQMGQNDRAIEVLQRAARLRSEDETLLCVLGQAHEAAGNTDKARHYYAAAVRANPNNPLGAALLADMSAGAGLPD